MSRLILGLSSACGDGFPPSCLPAVPRRVHRGARRSRVQASVWAQPSSEDEGRQSAVSSCGSLSKESHIFKKPQSHLCSSHVAEGGRQAYSRASSAPDASPRSGAHTMPRPRETPWLASSRFCLLRSAGGSLQYPVHQQSSLASSQSDSNEQRSEDKIRQTRIQFPPCLFSTPVILASGCTLEFPEPHPRPIKSKSPGLGFQAPVALFSKLPGCPARVENQLPAQCFSNFSTDRITRRAPRWACQRSVQV